MISFKCYRVIFTLFVILTATWAQQNEYKLAGNDYDERMTILQRLLSGENGRDVSHLLSHVVDGLLDPETSNQQRRHLGFGLPNSKSGSCQNYSCGYCMHLEWEKVNLNDTVCANVSYLPAPIYGISVTLSLDNKIIFNKTVSAQNPPPVCVAIPYLKDLASLCVRLYNISFTNSTLSACADLEAHIKFIVVEKLHLGCFKLPPSELEIPTLGGAKGENYAQNYVQLKGDNLRGPKGDNYDMMYPDKLFFKSMNQMKNN